MRRIIVKSGRGKVDFNPRTHRGVRRRSIWLWPYINNFNPRTHRGVRPCSVSFIKSIIKISIHAPIVGCDSKWRICNRYSARFQSTHPSWGATIESLTGLSIIRISIHAPIVGCDPRNWESLSTDTRFQSTHPSWGATCWEKYKHWGLWNFNPRTHRGVRPFYVICDII